MAKSTVYHKGTRGEAVSFNMTPLIDVTFQLIIFFILAGQMASQELAQLKLSRPYESQARDSEVSIQRVVVNIVSAVEGKKEGEASAVMAAQAKEYRIGPMKIAAGNTELLTNELKKLRDKAGKDSEFFVEIRSDYRVCFAQVRPVMMAAAAANIPKMNITALLATGK